MAPTFASKTRWMAAASSAVASCSRTDRERERVRKELFPQPAKVEAEA